MIQFNNITLDSSITEYKKYRKTQIITKDSFKEYCKQLEKEKKYVSIIRNTKLKEIKESDISEDDEVLLIDNKYYKIKEAKEKYTAGYIAVDTDKFIRVERCILIPILLFIIFIVLLLSINFGNKPKNIKIDDSAIDWNGENPNTKGTIDQENIEIPGFYKFVATEKNTSVPLYNPTSNTVYFTYSIFEITDSSVAATFNSETEAQEYIRNNEIEYTEQDNNIIDNNTGNILETVPYFKIMQSNNQNNQYEVVKEELKLLSCTDMIKPGKQVLWNPYNYIQKGEYNLRFKIRTFDIESGLECYGGMLTVEGILE